MSYQLILLLPLLGALTGLFYKYLPQKISILFPTISVMVAAGLSVYVFFTDMGKSAEIYPLWTWIDIAGLKIDWAIRSDSLSRMMLPVVTIVSALVHLYSIGYMHEDDSQPRFFAYLSLFTFMMLSLVTANNFLQLFFGWEGVGLASYLLIGFWFYKQTACAASIKAFVVNRVADCAFLLGLGLIYVFVGSFDFDIVFAKASELQSITLPFLFTDFKVIDAVCLLLLLGAMGKSAQFLLHTWLPDAMEGPTPVSALIHAATMVTAGVFLVARCSYLYEFSSEFIHSFMIFVGMATSLFAATVALTQFDIKRVIAYSTCSQLGYMFFAAGVGAYQAALFHLFTHAFFKAMLFLGAGSVIHAMHHEQDMRHMGGLWKRIPLTATLMIIGTLAITGVGIPFVFGSGLGFAGFYSKDMILEVAFASPRLYADMAFYLGLTVAFLTSFYSWRLIFMVFFGKERQPLHHDAHHEHHHNAHEHAHESPLVMLVPIITLMLGAVFAGGVFYEKFVGHDMAGFWGTAIFNGIEDLYHKAHHVPSWVKLSPLVASVFGFVVSYFCYLVRPSLPASLASDFTFFYRFLYKKWYFDELYQMVFVANYQKLSTFFAHSFDYGVIDKLICGTPVAVVRKLGILGRSVHNGLLSQYAYVMFFGVVIMLLIILTAGV